MYEEHPNYFEWLSLELLENVIDQFTPALEYQDYQSWIQAYPSLSEKISSFVTRLDFLNGSDLVDSTGRMKNFPDTQAPSPRGELVEKFPRLQEYRCHVCENSTLDPVRNERIFDPRARHLFISAIRNEKRIERNGIETLKKIIESRINRYGSEFTLIFAPYGEKSVEHKSSEFGFSFHNGVLHLEGTYYNSVDRKTYDLLNEVPELLEQIIKAFAPVIQVIGVDDVYFLHEIFINSYLRELIPQVTVAYLNYPRYERVREEFSLINYWEFPGFFDCITEIRFSPCISGQRFLLKEAVAEELVEYLRLRSQDQVFLKSITVMELPIPLAEKEYVQKLFPRVAKFQFQEHLERDYHFEQYERIKAKIDEMETQ
jgi:hypothetical protein